MSFMTYSTALVGCRWYSQGEATLRYVQVLPSPSELPYRRFQGDFAGQ